MLFAAQPSSACVERRRDMVRNAPRRDQHGVEPDIANAIVGMASKPGIGGGNNAPALTFGDRPRRIVAILSCLDLDEDEEASAPCDDIDLADRALPAACQDAKALGDE